MADTLILTLSTGEQIVADVDEQSGAYLCSNVLEIARRYDESGELKIGLQTFMPYSNQEAGFIVPTIMATVAVPGKDLIDYHKKAFSKIITPDTPSIILAS